MTTSSPIYAKRVYEDPADWAGFRVLVDRLWPRGLRKADAGFDEWLKNVAPSTELRKWYGHQPDRFEEFRKRYEAELRREPAASALQQLREKAERGPVTLLTATKDLGHSGAEVLRQVLVATH